MDCEGRGEEARNGQGQDVKAQHIHVCYVKRRSSGRHHAREGDGCTGEGEAPYSELQHLVYQVFCTFKSTNTFHLFILFIS